MKIQAKIQKWGSGLALRITDVMRDIPALEEGTPIEVQVFEDRLEVRKLHAISPLEFFTESDLLKGMTPETAHSDIIATPLESEF